MAWVHQSQFNLGEISPGAAIKPGSAAALAGLKDFKNGLVRYDNVLEKRHGSTELPISLGQTGRMIAFSFSPQNRKFMILLVANDITLTSRIHIFEKVAGEWVGSPIDAFQGVIPSSTVYRDIPSSGEQDAAPHPYDESELDGVTAVEYNDRIFLLHEDYVPIMLQINASALTVFATFTKWLWDDSSFKTGPELAGRRNPVLFTFSTRSSTSFARVTASYPIFRGNMAPVRVPATTAPATVGSVFRIGGSKADNDEDSALYGQWWMVERHLGPNVVDIKKIDTGFTSTIQVDQNLSVAGRFQDESLPHDWAGPWIDDGVNLQSYNVTATLFNGQNRIFNTVTAGRERVGELWIRQSPTTGTIDVAILVVSSTDTQMIIANVGPQIALQNLTDLRVLRPEPRSGIAIVDGRKVPTANQSTDQTNLTFWQDDGLPEGHEEGFQSVNFGRNGGAPSIDVGGTFFMNGGVLRIIGKSDPTSGSNDAAKSWVGYWERTPSSAAPCSSWGYGWSRGTGFPDVGAVHQQRLVLGGYKTPGSALSASAPLRPNDMNALDFVENEDAPLNLELTSGDDSERIRWLASANRHLQIGTDKGEYSLRGVPLSPSSIGLEPHSKYGSGTKAGGVASVGPASAFIAEGGLVLREMQAEADTGQFVSPNVLSLSQHLLDPGETYEQIVGVNHRFPLYAVRTSAGRLLFMSRDQENEIVAPSFHENSSGNLTRECLHIWRMEGENGYDVIWSTWRYLTPVTQEYVVMYYEFDRYMDSYTVKTNGQYTAVSLNVHSYLRGSFIDVIHDGVYWGQFQVPDTGVVVDIDPPFPNTFSNVEYGESYTFKATPTVKDLSGPGGSSVAQIRQVNNMRLFLVDSQGGDVVEDNICQISNISLRSAAPTVVNGWVDVPGTGINGRDPSPSVQSRYPFPFRVSSIVMEVSMK